MTVNELLATILTGNLGLLKMTLGDLSDADLLARPVPNANHPNWQLGHLLLAEHRMFTNAGATMPQLPQGFADKYTKQAAASNDPAAFATKDQLLDLFEKTRAAAIAWVSTATAEQFSQPAPESIRFLAPNIGALAALAAAHTAMHVGQIQVLRRSIGKPVLF